MKKVMIGFIAGVIFATAGTATASTVIEKVTASVRTDYSVEVDGQKVKLENAPLAYQGSAYIAVREISNVIGKEVGFEDGVIKINTPDAVPGTPEGAGNSEEMTQETYNTKMTALVDRKETAIRRIEFNKDAIRRADNGEFKPSSEEYEEFKSVVAYYESELVEVEKEIADLKAAYPQYAE